MNLDKEQLKAVKKLKKLLNRIRATKDNLEERVKFVVCVYKWYLYRDLIEHLLVDDYDLSGRDLDDCFEMGDGEIVVFKFMQILAADASLKSAFIMQESEEFYNTWVATHDKFYKENFLDLK